MAKKDYEIPIERLSAEPVELMRQLVSRAGVKECQGPGCHVRWLGGHGRRVYCSTQCATRADAERRKPPQQRMF